VLLLQSLCRCCGPSRARLRLVQAFAAALKQPQQGRYP